LEAVRLKYLQLFVKEKKFMSAKEIVVFILQLLGILTAWPVILLIIILIFRHQVSQFLPDLAKRLKKADIAGSSFEFAEAAVNALKDTVESGLEKFKDNPEELPSFLRKQLEKVPEASAPSKSVAQSPSLSGRSILWVDDNPLNNAYEESFFRQLGATVTQAISTEQALNYLASNKYDLIISDVHRVENGRSNPNAGYELLEEIRRRKIEVPFVFYTSSVARVSPERARLANGVADRAGKLRNLVIDILRQ
jgi:CheY-like chemotaxis protein